MSQLRYLVNLTAARDEQTSSSLPFIGLEDIESHTGRLVKHTVPSLDQGLNSASESKSGTRFLDREMEVLTEVEGTVHHVIQFITERRASVIQSGVIGQFISREVV